MTTDNAEKRALGTLLTLETYQGMSDEEIETIITYKTNEAYAKGNRDAINSQGMMNVLENKKKVNDMFARVESVLRYNGQ